MKGPQNPTTQLQHEQGEKESFFMEKNSFFPKNSTSVAPKGEAPNIQRKSNPTKPPVSKANTLPDTLSKTKGEGDSLSKEVKAEMIPFFGPKINDVKVHQGEDAHNMNQELGSEAFAHNKDVYFQKGSYQPNTQKGKHLLAHELTHTLQSSQDMIQKYDHRVTEGQSVGVIAQRYGITTQQLLDANPSIARGSTIHPNQVLHIPIREHRVEGGDTLGGLAREYGVSIEAIRQANELTDDTIGLNDLLAIPGFDATAAATPPAHAPTTPPTTPTPAQPAAPATPPASPLLAGNPTEILSSSDRSRLRYTRQLVLDFDQWTSQLITRYMRRLGGSIAQDLRDTLEGRVRNLVRFRRTLRSTLTAHLAEGDDFLTLANIVFNEGGSFGEAAQRAVGYAWLNRNGGNVAANRGADLSGYVRLSVRWNGYGTLAQQLTFIENFVDSLQATHTVLSDSNRTANDPTHGATHWVSPQGLPAYNSGSASHRNNRYSRDYGSHRNRAFPKYAIANNDTARLEQARRDGIILDNYQEITVPGIPGAQFLFYRGVR